MNCVVFLLLKKYKYELKERINYAGNGITNRIISIGYDIGSSFINPINICQRQNISWWLLSQSWGRS